MSKYSEPFEVILDSTEETKKYCIKNPTHEEVMICDMEYKRLFSLAVREGVMTVAEANKQMKETGAWAEEDTKEVSKYMASLAIMEIKLRDREGEQTELDKLANEATVMRNKLMFKMRIQTEILDKTAEGIGEQAKIYKSIRYCLVDAETKDRVFDDVDEFEEFNEENPSAISYIYRKTYLYEHGLDEDIAETWEETMYLKQRSEEIKKEAKEVEKQQKKKSKSKKKNKVKVGDS